MTMSSSRRAISASSFKARCLALLDEVARTRDTILVTKRGKPVARLVSAAPALRRSLRGSVTVHGDLTAPIDERWQSDP
jgi:prevent-host-death family protein